MSAIVNELSWQKSHRMLPKGDLWDKSALKSPTIKIHVLLIPAVNTTILTDNPCTCRDYPYIRKVDKH